MMHSITARIGRVQCRIIKYFAPPLLSRSTEHTKHTGYKLSRDAFKPVPTLVQKRVILPCLGPRPRGYILEWVGMWGFRDGRVG